MFSHKFELSIGIKAGALVVVSLPKCDPKPFLGWIDLNRLMLLHTLMGAIILFGKSVRRHFYVLLMIVFRALSR